MKILVPTDLSNASRVAITYAAGIASMFHAEIILLYVAYLDRDVKTRSSAKNAEMIDSKAREANEKLKDLISTLRIENALLHVTSVILEGIPLEEVVTNYAHYNAMDLIVMGTKGANSASPALLGSNTAATINTSTIPVIAVPELSRYKKIETIVYASDLEKLDHEVSLLLPLARLCDAKIEILYIVAPGSKEKVDAAAIEEDIVIRSGYSKIRLHVVLNDSLMEGIDAFLMARKADLLAMYTHELGFFDRLFGKGHTRNMSFHIQVPLLAIKKKSHLVQINRVTTQ